MKFECQTSCGGKCCKIGKDSARAFVFLTKDDIERIGVHLKQVGDNRPFIMRGKFHSTRFNPDGGEYFFLAKDESSGAYMFLEQGKCSIYGAHPTQCRTYPFWPGYLDKDKIKEEAEYCPGIGEGQEVDGSAQAGEQIIADGSYDEANR